MTLQNVVKPDAPWTLKNAYRSPLLLFSIANKNQFLSRFWDLTTEDDNANIELLGRQGRVNRGTTQTWDLQLAN